MPPLDTSGAPLAPLRPDFAALYDQHFAWLYGAVGRLGVGGPLREDVLQDVWVTVHRRMDSLRSDASERAWLLAIARRVISLHRRTHFRADRRASALGAVAPPSQATPAERAEARDLLQRVLADMDADQREVLVLSCVDGMTGPEIAEALGVPLNTVYSRLRLARRRADDELSRAFPDEDLPEGARARGLAALAPLLMLDRGSAAPPPTVVSSAMSKLALVFVAVTAVATGLALTGRERTAVPAAAALAEPVEPAAAAAAEPAESAAAAAPAESAAAGEPVRRAPVTTMDVLRPAPRIAVVVAPGEDVEGAADPPASRRPDRRDTWAQPDTASSSTPDEGSSIVAENRILQPAVAALRRGEPKVALSYAAQHQARFADGVLADVREATRVRAHCALGDSARGEGLGRRWLEDHPGSTTVRAAVQSCVTDRSGSGDE